MEVSEDRGIECQGVCFDFIDGKVVLAIYQNLPGIKRELSGTTFLKAFTIDDWKAINGYLMDVVEDVEGNYEGSFEEEEEEEVAVLTKVNNIPKMTADEVQEKFDPITGTQNKEEGDEELADITSREEGNDGKE